MRFVNSVLVISLFRIFISVGLTLAAVLPKQQGSKSACGYDTCTKSDWDKLNIHLVPHTHDDVGWLKTVDQYYFGGRMNIQVAGVQYIIDSVVDALNRDPARKFIYVETAYLWKWWTHQDEKRKDNMRKLINEGRLEIIGGGWSMNDEAVTHYHSIIDQHTWGFRRLNDTFGTCARPKIGWQIDPFGHSREQASIFAQMGFDGLFFARLDYQDKMERLQKRTGEFIWKGSASLDDSTDLFTSVLYNFYNAPPGFCFDILCQDTEPMIDDHDSPDYNIERKVNTFLQFVEEQNKHYRTNNVIITMGGDFTYQYAGMNFKNMDKLIRYINEKNGTKYKAFYSTPSCYLKAANDQNITWPIKTDDFFPYSSDSHAFWTGYFSSRPTLKYFERMGNNFLQVVKQLLVLTNQPDRKELELFREAMGVMQHHDAITGTEKQHVAADYARILHQSFTNGEKITTEALKKWLFKKKNVNPIEFNSCLLLNISSCSYTSQNSKFVVTVYNPTSQPLTTYIRLPVQNLSYSVKDYTGLDIVVQIVPIPDPVKNIPGRFENATVELVFMVLNISPFGYQSYYVSPKPNPTNNTQNNSSKTVEQRIGGEFYNVSVDSQGKVLFKSLKAGTGLSFEQSFHYYEGAAGKNRAFNDRASGAYIFRPKENNTKNFPVKGTYTIIKGPLVEEIQHVINDWISQVIRIYNGKNYIEFNWLVGPIPIGDNIGKEVITKYASNVMNNGEFFTDSNGREMIKRKINFRPTWNVNLQEPISGNYYPVTAKITMRDSKNQSYFTVLTDRAQGGSSLKDGEIELMLHRRLMNDDGFGVGEALNESAFDKGLVVRGQHYILGGKLVNLDEMVLQEKELAIDMALRPWIVVTPITQTFEEWNEFYKMQSETLIKPLPKNVRILTLEPWKQGEVLLRLEHLFEKGETPKYSTSVEVDIKELLSGFQVHSVTETTLGGNQWINDLHRLKWRLDANVVLKHDNSSTSANSISTANNKIIVRLNPMQIRTFIVKLSLGATG